MSQLGAESPDLICINDLRLTKKQLKNKQISYEVIFFGWGAGWAGIGERTHLFVMLVVDGNILAINWYQFLPIELASSSNRKGQIQFDWVTLLSYITVFYLWYIVNRNDKNRKKSTIRSFLPGMRSGVESQIRSLEQVCHRAPFLKASFFLNHCIENDITFYFPGLSNWLRTPEFYHRTSPGSPGHTRRYLPLHAPEVNVPMIVI